MKCVFLSSIALVAARPQVALPSWEEFKAEYGKYYNSNDEDSFRSEVYGQKIGEVEAQNAAYDQGDSTWWATVNVFSDWTEEEFVSTLLNYSPEQSILNQTDIPVYEEVHNEAEVGEKIWSVSPVKNQGSCGSCWAFGAVAGMEGSAKTKLGRSDILSEQYVMDCTSSNACGGGRADSAYPYLYGQPLYTQASYPYSGRSGASCVTGTDSGLRISSFTRSFPRSGSDSQLASALDSNPLVVAVGASYWSSYGGGIYSDSSSCSLNHQVYATGYDSSSIKVKNSWGTSWGESGYIRLSRSTSGCGTSGILSDGGFYPTMGTSASDVVV